jgi:hypothetical protein
MVASHSYQKTRLLHRLEEISNDPEKELAYEVAGFWFLFHLLQLHSFLSLRFWVVHQKKSNALPQLLNLRTSHCFIRTTVKFQDGTIAHFDFTITTT